MLKQLPISGDWIDPATVTRVNVWEESTNMSGQYAPPRVAITLGSIGYTEIRCTDMDQAKRLRDQIAAMVNEALEQSDA